RQGARLHVVALRRPPEVVQLERIDRLQADVDYLPRVSVESPARASSARIALAHAPLFLNAPRRYLNALGEVLPSLASSTHSLRGGGLLAHRLLMLGSPPLYVHFAHKPATVGRFASRLAGVPYGLSAHAKDVWLTPRPELARKVRDAEVVLT